MTIKAPLVNELFNNFLFGDLYKGLKDKVNVIFNSTFE